MDSSTYKQLMQLFAPQAGNGFSMNGPVASQEGGGMYNILKQLSSLKNGGASTPLVESAPTEISFWNADSIVGIPPGDTNLDSDPIRSPLNKDLARGTLVGTGDRSALLDPDPLVPDLVAPPISGIPGDPGGLRDRAVDTILDKTPVPQTNPNFSGMDQWNWDRLESGEPWWMYGDAGDVAKTEKDLKNKSGLDDSGNVIEKYDTAYFENLFGESGGDGGNFDPTSPDFDPATFDSKAFDEAADKAEAKGGIHWQSWVVGVVAFAATGSPWSGYAAGKFTEKFMDWLDARGVPKAKAIALTKETLGDGGMDALGDYDGYEGSFDVFGDSDIFGDYSWDWDDDYGWDSGGDGGNSDGGMGNSTSTGGSVGDGSEGTTGVA